VGKDKAHGTVTDNEIIEEHDLNPMPENIPSAVTEENVLKDLYKMEKVFHSR